MHVLKTLLSPCFNGARWRPLLMCPRLAIKLIFLSCACDKKETFWADRALDTGLIEGEELLSRHYERYHLHFNASFWLLLRFYFPILVWLWEIGCLSSKLWEIDTRVSWKYFKLPPLVYGDGDLCDSQATRISAMQWRSDTCLGGRLKEKTVNVKSW